MKNKSRKNKRKFVRYIRRTFTNKVFAVALIGIGMIVSGLIDDATFLAFAIILGVPLFFIDSNYILD